MAMTKISVDLNIFFIPLLLSGLKYGQLAAGMHGQDQSPAFPFDWSAIQSAFRPFHPFAHASSFTWSGIPPFPNVAPMLKRSAGAGSTKKQFVRLLSPKRLCHQNASGEC
jgi:hypothetical protein